jgi:hypothetical protein
MSHGRAGFQGRRRGPQASYRLETMIPAGRHSRWLILLGRVNLAPAHSLMYRGASGLSKGDATLSDQGNSTRSVSRAGPFFFDLRSICRTMCRNRVYVFLIIAYHFPAIRQDRVYSHDSCDFSQPFSI